MENKNLKNIRKKYKEFVKLRQNYQELLKKKKELEEEPKVQEYLNLLDEFVDSWNRSYILGSNVQESSDEQLIQKAVDTETIVNSNKIFVCMGTYKRSDEVDIIHGASDYRVNKNDPLADYRIYSDIEKNSLHAKIEVPISKCEEFEKNNVVLYPNKCVSSEYYNNVRNIFFETAIKQGQKKAIEKVMSMK